MTGDDKGLVEMGPKTGPIDEEPEEASPKKKRNKLKITGIVVAVIVVLAIAFFVWHETPGFCNSVCHDPMDPYVESISSGDKGMMAVVHADNGVYCLKCHEAKLTEQVSEVMHWVSDDFTTDSQNMLVPAKDFANEEFCGRGDCHDTGNLAEATVGFEGNDEKYNPHSSHQDLALECGDCHKAHSTSVLVCNSCHALTVPEGWEG